ncbi:MAG TPA: hypothetical protein VF584_23870 [Longimicrobium sp.]|jgi:hypothetical protein
MTRPDSQLVSDAPLPYLLSAPAGTEVRPVLCFLHGYDEGPPADIRRGVTAHGPLRPDGAPGVVGEFLVVAPQLPARGDLWHRHAGAVQRIVRNVHERHGGDPERSYLTGFSFGGNGVFDLGLAQREFWAALWAVDPTRIPPADPGLPVWLSFGEVGRYGKQGFLRRLALQEAGAVLDGNRYFTDRGEDHVGSAASAYREERVYRWLLSKRRAAPAPGAE